MAKKLYVLESVEKNLRDTSATPSGSYLRLSQGDELEIMYQRRGSEPNFSIVSKGSTALPLRLDIFSPFLSSTRPLEITALKARESKAIVPMA